MTVSPSTTTEPLRFPQGTCDTHFHVFDAARYPYATVRSYTPADATMADYIALRLRYGIDRAVLVQPSVFGADHRYMEDSLRAHGDCLRAVAVVFAETTDAQLAHWHALGVRGSRVNTLFAGGADPAQRAQTIARIAPLGWHVQLLIDVAAQPDMADSVADKGVPVVIDHLGHHPPGALLKSAGFANLLALLRDGNAWVKLSGPYRSAADAPRYAASQAVVDRLIEANVDRLLWGSDWPHPPSHYPIPPTPQLMDLVYDWLPDAALRQTVLVDNPSRLYWADAGASKSNAKVTELSEQPIGAAASG